MKTTEDVHGNLHVMPYDVDTEWEPPKRDPINLARAFLRGTGWALFVSFFLWAGWSVVTVIDRWKVSK